MRKLRVQRACRLLSQSEMAVTDICFEVGYNNLSNFNRHFRVEMNQTPSDYRRSLSTDSPTDSVPVMQEKTPP